MIELNELEEYYENGIVPDDARLNELYSFFSDSDLMLAINGGIFALFGERELIIPMKLYRQSSGIDFNTFIETKIKPYVDKQLLAWFRMRSSNYQRLYDAINAEYNPLYNVDGTEVRNYEKNNTGTQGNNNIRSGSETDNVAYVGTETDNLSYVGSETDNISYVGTETDNLSYVGTETDNVSYVGTETDTNTESGSIIDTNTKAGKEKESTTFKGSEMNTATKSGNETLGKVGGDINSTTTFDSQTPQETTRSMKAPSTLDTTTYNNVTDKDYKIYGVDSSGTVTQGLERTDETEKTFENYQDTNTRTFGQDGHIETNVKSFTDRSDNRTKGFNGRADNRTKGFTDRADNRTKGFNGRADNRTKGFTDRADNRTVTYNNVTDAGTRTDNLKEKYTETLRRYGNIGVTKSTDLVESEILLREKYNLAEMISHDMVNFICYGC